MTWNIEWKLKSSPAKVEGFYTITFNKNYDSLNLYVLGIYQTNGLKYGVYSKMFEIKIKYKKWLLCLLRKYFHFFNHDFFAVNYYSKQLTIDDSEATKQ